MIKKILFGIAVLILALFILVGCDNTPKDKTNDYVIPTALKDCKISVISGKTVKELYVVRCPNSTTSTNWDENCGKNCTRHESVNTIDDYPTSDYR